MKKLKTLDPNERRFTANGKVYNIETELSINRFHEYQIYEKEAGFSMDFKSIVHSIKDAYQDINQLKAADAAVKLHNVLAGIAKVQEKEHTLLKMCALFINTDDEDRGIINADMISTKIEDWGKEYEVQGFFTLALNTINGFLQIYAEQHRIISVAVGEVTQ